MSVSANRTVPLSIRTRPVTALNRVVLPAPFGPISPTIARSSHRNCDAARHLYRVTSGLESMVVGEAEIQGQVRRAYDAALSKDTVGPLTNRLFTAALATGKRVRSETAIGERQLSLPAVAVALARELLGSLTGRQVVIIGTGETSELTARALADSGGRTLFVASRRRRDRAIAPRGALRRHQRQLRRAPSALESADIVVSATASPHALIEARELTQVMGDREGRPVLLIDLAVPRDIDAACGDIEGVSLYDIDDLQAVIARNRRVRQAEARKAEGIIEEEIQQFATWLGSLEVLPTIAALPSSRDRDRRAGPA